MAKPKKVYFCQNCGFQSSQWTGKCSSCGEWNTFVEEIVDKKSTQQLTTERQKEVRNIPFRLDEISTQDTPRIALQDQELHRVLGGGLVPGSLVLLGGEPGIGKSTLLLQLALENQLKVLYISGEESVSQIKLRAERLDLHNEQCFLYAETSTQSIFKHLDSIQPDLLIVDSIQTLYSSHIESSPGSVSQIRECTHELLRFAKQTNTPTFLIGHITKDGHIAGPKVMEHMVDTVLQFEGDRHHIYRLLRTTKNRFGSTHELGIYEMRGEGLHAVKNPSKVLTGDRDNSLSGIAIGATMEGLRPLLIETQALVSSAAYGTPQRSATGFDIKRLNMLLAVLEKRCGFKLGAKDVFLNIAGGIKVDDPAMDLAVVSSILSSNADIPADANTCLSGEIGLSGEIRPVNRVEQRISEAEKLGFERIIVSAFNKNISSKKFDIEIVEVRKIEEVVRTLFG